MKEGKEINNEHDYVHHLGNWQYKMSMSTLYLISRNSTNDCQLLIYPDKVQIEEKQRP